MRTPPRSPLALAATAALALALAACGSDTPGSAQAPATPQPAAQPATGDGGEVVVQGFRFQPQVLEIAAGTTVVWRNTDGINHTATSGQPDAADGAFDVDLPEAGSSGEHTFTEAGTFAYFCTVHESMTGEVVVAG